MNYDVHKFMLIFKNCTHSIGLEAFQADIVMEVSKPARRRRWKLGSAQHDKNWKWASFGTLLALSNDVFKIIDQKTGAEIMKKSEYTSTVQIWSSFKYVWRQSGIVHKHTPASENSVKSIDDPGT